MTTRSAGLLERDGGGLGLGGRSVLLQDVMKTERNRATPLLHDLRLFSDRAPPVADLGVKATLREGLDDSLYWCPKLGVQRSDPQTTRTRDRGQVSFTIVFLLAPR
jgi:hypothetical protein